MAINKVGFAALNQQFNDGTGQAKKEELFRLNELETKFITGRVTDIIISDGHPLFNDFSFISIFVFSLRYN